MARTLGVNQALLESEGLDSVLERLTLEIQRSLDHFDRQFGGIPVDRLLLAPMDKTDGLREGLAGNLALPVEVLNLADVLDVADFPDLERCCLPSASMPSARHLRMEDTKP